MNFELEEERMVGFGNSGTTSLVSLVKFFTICFQSSVPLKP